MGLSRVSVALAGVRRAEAAGAQSRTPEPGRVRRAPSRQGTGQGTQNLLSRLRGPHLRPPGWVSEPGCNGGFVVMGEIVPVCRKYTLTRSDKVSTRESKHC